MKKDFYERYWDDAEHALPSDDPTTKTRTQYLSKTLDSERDIRKILDAGCGSGYFSAYLKDAGYESMGMDVSSNAVTAAGGKHPHINFICSPLMRNGHLMTLLLMPFFQRRLLSTFMEPTKCLVK